jgi:hypothetical protein
MSALPPQHWPPGSPRLIKVSPPAAEFGLDPEAAVRLVNELTATGVQLGLDERLVATAQSQTDARLTGEQAAAQIGARR